MKRSIVLLAFVVPVILGTVLFSGCKKKTDDTPSSGTVTETLFVNPGDDRIISLDSAGRKVVYMGTKDATGMPLTITQALVDAPNKDPENRTLIKFDELGRVKNLSSKNEGFMEFNYVNDTTVVIIYTQPNNLGTFQLSFNPKKPTKSGGCGCDGVKLPAVRLYPERNPLTAPAVDKTAYRPADNFPVKPSKPAADGNIYLMYNMTGNPVTGGIVTGTYQTAEGKTGDVMIKDGDGPGNFKYTLPFAPAPPPPSGFSQKAYSLLNLICIGALPVGLGIGKICAGTLTPMTIATCTAILTAYVWICRTNTIKNVGNFVVDFFTTEATVYITVKHPIFPTRMKEGTVKPSQGIYPEMNFGYDDYALIKDLYTTPADPDPSQGYVITARIENGIPGQDQVKLYMIGTDGYTKTETFTLDASGMCSMSIPGAEQGVRDEITAEVLNYNPPRPGQSKTITIVF